MSTYKVVPEITTCKSVYYITKYNNLTTSPMWCHLGPRGALCHVATGTSWPTPSNEHVYMVSRLCHVYVWQLTPQRWQSAMPRGYVIHERQDERREMASSAAHRLPRSRPNDTIAAQVVTRDTYPALSDVYPLAKCCHGQSNQHTQV